MRKEISRNYWLILLMGFCLILALDCDKKPSSGSGISGNLKYFQFSSKWSICVGCSERYEFECIDNSQGGQNYYWLGMLDKNGILVAYGDAKAYSPPTTIKGRLAVGYFSHLPTASYQFHIFACTTASEAGDMSKAYDLTSGLVKNVNMNFNSDLTCQQDECCHYIERQYVQAQRHINYIVGVSADILTRYGKPCNYSTSYENAFNTVYCGISDTSGRNSGQIGFGYERNYNFFGKDTAVQFWYNETLYDGIRANYDLCTLDSAGKTPVTPQESFIYSYKCELDPSNGIWYYIIIDAFGSVDTVNTYPDARFNMTCKVATWAGEIYNYEDDMAGTFYDRCEISGLKYKTSGGNYQNFQIATADSFSSDPNHWMFNKVNDTAFEIWDVIEQ